MSLGFGVMLFAELLYVSVIVVQAFWSFVVYSLYAVFSYTLSFGLRLVFVSVVFGGTFCFGCLTTGLGGLCTHVCGLSSTCVLPLFGVFCLDYLGWVML